ncbi:histidine kinase dimerization/phospho-acceptor domain-containing protein [Clostridium sp. CMCC3677]|uniref:sensor histidine kinase n=1 Tax=Clostridium sp. CMCC3677 TaxID=2949963 RepID=UPI0013F0C7A2|nr:histidine kinase dimerization/phospho-acceptor domain-containing protein [Clostridium sp. CMCC3677]NFG61413.1 GHKL domain-containing protein [Clostridium botulinum]NFQ10395.1 GHKL domain-containing protein [Clostridium botulinum]
MDTKLKNNKKIRYTNLLILLLCIMILPIFMSSSNKFIRAQNNTKVEQFLVDVMNDVCFSARDMNYYVNESDGSLKEEAIQNQIKYLENVDRGSLNDVTNEIKNFMSDNEENNNLPESDEEKLKFLEHNEYYNEMVDRRNKLEEKLKQGDEAYREEGIKSIQDYLEDKYQYLAEYRNVEYYIEKNEEEEPITNIKGKSKNDIINETQSNYKYYIMFLNINYKVPEEINVSNSLKESINGTHNYYGIQNLYNNKQVIVRISNPLKSGDEIANDINEKNEENFKGYAFLILTLLDIFMIIILILKCKKTLYLILKDNFIIRLYKNLFIEIRCLIFVLSIICLRFLYDVVCWSDILYWNDLYTLIIVEFISIYLVVSDIRNLYLLNKEINIKNYICKKSLLYKMLFKMKELMKESFLIKSTSSRLIISIIVFITYAIVVFIQAYWMGYVGWWPYMEPYEVMKLIPSIIFTICIIMYFLFVARNINRIKIGTDNILKGNYNNKIDVKGAIILKDIANNVMNIEDGLDKAIDKAVKSEKMKGELITNVSHDLKTPLTSIINYIDLLDKENVSEEDKKRYLEILKERSLRLKVLIEDLFEASKAASGTLELDMENLDLVALIRQTIGEFENEIEKSNLQFIKNIPEKKLSIYADGKKTFRVFQNLISNILKYSMKNSRVYIEVFEENEYISIVFKNISEYQVDFTEEEILERFKRGDSSRTTEGSGLGLSIAKSLVELQGGQFTISIDGDLFKVVVNLKKA